jgi:hypothetical protein
MRQVLCGSRRASCDHAATAEAAQWTGPDAGISEHRLADYHCHMASRILTVEDTFEIGGRGLVVVPAPTLDAYSGPAELPVEIRRPNGSMLKATLNFTHVFLAPPPKVPRWELVFRGLSKSDIPIGSEVWG